MCIDVIMHEWCWRNVSCVQASQSATLSPLVLHWKWSQLQKNVHWIDLSAFVHFKIGFRFSGSFPFFFQLCSDSLFGFYPLHSKETLLTRSCTILHKIPPVGAAFSTTGEKKCLVHHLPNCKLTSWQNKSPSAITGSDVENSSLCKSDFNVWCKRMNFSCLIRQIHVSQLYELKVYLAN